MFIICVLGSQDLMMRQDLRRVGGGGILIYNTLSGICKTNAQCPLSNDITTVTGRQTDPVQSVILDISASCDCVLSDFRVTQIVL